MKNLLKKSVLPVLGGMLLTSAVMAQESDLKNPNLVAGTSDVIIYSVSTPPTIDGVIDDKDTWSAGQWINQTSIKGTASGATSKFQLTKDADNIYLAVQVVDNTPSVSPSIPNDYERDCIETFFSMDPTSTSYASGVWQLRIQRDGNRLTGRSSGQWSLDSTSMADSGFEFKTVSTSEGYVLEAKFPISMLQQDANFDGTNLKFDIQTADNTTGEAGGRTCQMFWNNNSDTQYGDPTIFTDIQFSGDFAPMSVKNVVEKPASVSVDSENKTIHFVNVAGNVNIYSVNGVLIRSIMVDGNQVVGVSDLAKGIYIVSGEGLLLK